MLLGRLTGWEVEYSIRTAEVKDQFPSLPNHYCVDLALPELKIAVEVDGASHRTKKWKFLDKRKTEVLNALGWIVLRFWNEEVETDINMVMTKIASCTN